MKKLNIILFFFSFLFVSTFSQQASANSEQGFEYEYGDQSLATIETSNHQVLVEQVDIDTDKWNNLTTIVRYNDKGKKLATLQLGYGEQNFVKYRGKAFILFTDDNTKQLKVYNENFKLISINSFLLDSLDNLRFLGQEKESIFYFDYSTEQKITFSLKELAFVPSSPYVKDASVYNEGTDITINLFDQFDTRISKTTFNNVIDENFDISSSVLENNIIYTVATSPQSIDLYQFSLNGQVLNKLNVKSYNQSTLEAPFFDAIVMDGKILFVENEYDKEKEAIVFVYNMATNSIDYFDAKTGKPNYRYIGNGYIREYSFNEDSVPTVYDSNFNKLYTLSKSLTSLIYPGGDYFIVNYDNYGQVGSSDLHNIHTGKKIRTLITSNANYDKILVAEAMTFDNNTAIFFATQMEREGEDFISNPATGYITRLANKGAVATLTTSKNVEKTKEWEIILSQVVDPTSVTAETVFVTNKKGQRVDVTICVEGDTIFVSPPNNGYVKGEYKVTVTDVKSASGKKLKTNIEKTFIVE